MVERAKPITSKEDLIDFNMRMLDMYIKKMSESEKAEEFFSRLFHEYSTVNHNDTFHGNETLLYHQYMVLHSFNMFMQVIEKEFHENDFFIKNMHLLLERLETKTNFGRKELKTLFKNNPPACSKNLTTLSFLAVLFHDIGKMYNTEKWEKEFNDETLRLRKFQRHEGYGWSFFQILSTRKVHYDRLFNGITNRIKQEIAKRESVLETLTDKKKEEEKRKINGLKIDLYYTNASRQTIEQCKDLMEEMELNKNDYWFVAKMIEHHQTLFNDPSMDYKVYLQEKDIKKLSSYLKWVREKKLGKIGINKRTIANDFLFYGLMVANMSDSNGTGFSDHTIELAFKTYQKGDTFKGHHGDINSDVEFFGFLNYVYHNLSKADEEIIKNWFGVEIIKKEVTYNFGALFKAFPRDKALEIKLIIEKEGPKGLASKGYNVGEIMRIIRM